MQQKNKNKKTAVKKIYPYLKSKKLCINAKLSIGLTTKPFGTFVPKQHNYFKYCKRAKKLRFMTELPLFLAVWTGLEPATPCVTGMYSNQLNYQTSA